MRVKPPSNTRHSLTLVVLRLESWYRRQCSRRHVSDIFGDGVAVSRIIRKP